MAPEKKTKQQNTVPCHKCNGTGSIPGFAHVQHGVCFDCKGTGKLNSPKVRPVTYARAFCLQFYQRVGFFPEDQSKMQRLVCTGFEGHATAEEWVLKDDEFYYLGQPVCRSSTWWKIPYAQYADFVKNYLKAYKKQLPSFNLITT